MNVLSPIPAELATPRPRLRTALVADLFCGAGGSSTGARRALTRLGWRMDLVAVNHWPVAIDTHSRNHPEARHYCMDLEAAKPRDLVPEGRLDLLMASPTCTHHSRARGGRPTSDQQRMDPWHVVRWCTELRVKRLLIENVPEFVQWGPVDERSGKPVKSRRGEYFRAWVAALEAVGFRVEWKILNAADYGDATTRQRFFLLGRSDGRRLAWPEASHAARGASDLFGERQGWRPARDVIDWSLEGRSIYQRKRPLAPRTLQRIEAGLMKFGWPAPYLVVLRQHMAGRSLDEPLPALTAGGTHVGLVQPFVVSPQTSGAPRSVEDPLPTITTGGAGDPDHPGCARHAVVEPFLLSRQGEGAPRALDQPTPCQVAKHSHVMIAPYYGSGSGETCRSADDPLPTVTAKGRFGLIVPVTHDCAGNRARSVDQPMPTITTASRGELAFIAAAFGEREGQAPRVHDVDEPVPTICAQGRVPLVQPSRQWDIRFRMLEPHELAAAMGFADDEAAYEFAGTKTDRIRQIGNAVPVNTAAALVGAIMGEAA